MPVLVVWAVVAMVTVVTAVAAATYFSNARNKRIAVLGPRRSGKTKLAATLTSGVVTNAYIRTVLTERVRGDLEMDDLQLRVCVDDPGGSRDQYGEWQRIHSDAHLVCYVVDYRRLFTGDSRYVDHALNGAAHVQDWAGDKPVILVLTHVDKVPTRSAHPDTVLAHRDVLRLQRKLRPRQRLAVNLHDAGDRQKIRLSVAQQLVA